MAKRMYMGGSDGKAKRLKKAYVSVLSDVPVYEDGSVNVTGSNLDNYFSVTDSTYGFKWNSSENAFTSGNSGISSSSATSTWTAKKNLKNVTFKYIYGTESSYDKFTLQVNGTTLLSSASGAGSEKTWSGSIPKGNTVYMYYSKDGSVNSNGDICKVYDIYVDDKIITGTVKKDVGRKIKKGYLIEKGVVKKVFTANHENPVYNRYDSTGITFTKSQYGTGVTQVLSNKLSAFVGGNYYDGSSSNPTNTIQLFDRNGTHLGGISGPYTAVEIMGISSNRYGFFGGGYYGSGQKYVYTIDSDGSISSCTDLTQGSRNNMKGTARVGNYVLFAGGYASSVNEPHNKVVAYDQDKTQVVVGELTKTASNKSGMSVPSYAVFTAGQSNNQYNGYVSDVDAYTEDLTKVAGPSLSRACTGPSADFEYINIGVICESVSNGSGATSVEGITNDLTIISLPDSKVYHQNYGSKGVSLDGTLVFMEAASTDTKGFSVYDENLTVTLMADDRSSYYFNCGGVALDDMILLPYSTMTTINTQVATITFND